MLKRKLTKTKLTDEYSAQISPRPSPFLINSTEPVDHSQGDFMGLIDMNIGQWQGTQAHSAARNLPAHIRPNISPMTMSEILTHIRLPPQRKDTLLNSVCLREIATFSHK